MIDYPNPWTYQGQEFDPEEAKNWYGYIYIITNTSNKRKYIGRKYFSMAGRKTVKGKVKKIRKESDWKKYYGSSDELKSDVSLLGEDVFTREIVRLCKTRGECNYWEAKLIFETDALLSETWYNSWVSAKVHASHVKNLWKGDIDGQETST